MTTTPLPVPIGQTPDGHLITLPATGRILLAGDTATGKTVLAGRIAEHAPTDTVRWVIHDRHHDHAYPTPVDWRATSRAEATRMLATALELIHTPRPAGSARIRLTIDDTALLARSDLTGTALQATATGDTGIDLTLIGNPAHLSRQLAATFPIQVLFRHRGAHPTRPDLAHALRRLPNYTALVVQPHSTPVPVALFPPAHTLIPATDLDGYPEGPQS